MISLTPTERQTEMTDKRTPKRSEIAERHKWNLENFYKSDEQWSESFDILKAKIPEFAGYRGTLGQSSRNLYSLLKLYDSIMPDAEKIANYAMRRSDEDTSNSFYQDMKGKVIAFFTEFGAETSFIVPEITAIPDETIDSCYKEEPGLEMYRRKLYMIRRTREHILSDAEERIIAMTGEMQNVPDSVYTIFHSADLKFPDVIDSKGESYPLTQSSYIPLMESPDRTLRKNAFNTFYGVFGQYKNTSAALLDGQMKSLIFNARLRKYPDARTASLDSNEVPVSVYDALIEAVHQNLDKMYGYMALRKKLMGVEELHMYDVYAPIVSEFDEKISYEEAKENILKALKPLGDDYLEILKHGFDSRWIDVYENEGKVSGAYSAGSLPHPLVLMNYKDSLDSMFTLAHEMGHALHSYLSAKHQPVSYKDYVIFNAEVASTTNECLLMSYLLENTSDPRRKAYLINYFLEQFRTTVYRQTMFAEFEAKFAEAAEKGATLTADLLIDIYYKLNQLYYGDNIVIDEPIGLEWSRIPHFFMNFYVFQYATAFSAAVAISRKIKEEGEPAVKAYLTFLSSGCIDDPITLLKRAGVDMTTNEPVSSALSYFGELINQMEGLMND
jgi:oligoendopeptidase F